MDIKKERSQLISELEKVEDVSLLRAIRAVLRYGMKNEGRISAEDHNRELDEAESEVVRGNFTTHDDLKKQMKAW